MLVPEPKLLYMTFEEYLRFDEQSSERHEFIDGLVVAMTGESWRHNLITQNLSAIVCSHLDPEGPCRVFTSSVKTYIKAANSCYCPDVFVTCTPPDDDDSVLQEPTFIAEVLSPSTAGFDRRDKRKGYEQLDSTTEYMIIHQSKKRVEIFRKGTSGKFGLPDLIDHG